MRRFVLLFAIFAAGGPGLALAQSAWPQKPVRVLVGLAPGGNPDTLARMLAAKLGGALGQQFVVENRPGAGSTVAADITAKSVPVSVLNLSMVMWWIEPLPEDAYGMGCSRDLASATSSATELACTEGFATSHIGTTTASVTG